MLEEQISELNIANESLRAQIIGISDKYLAVTCSLKEELADSKQDMLEKMQDLKTELKTSLITKLEKAIY